MRRSDCSILLSSLAVAFLIVLTATTAHASSTSPMDANSPKTIPRIDRRIRIDGVVEETEWETAYSVELLYEISPGENIPALERTILLLAHDDGYLYAAFRVFDSRPQSIRARLHDRDAADNDDLVVLILDTFNDERNAYKFLVNPLGVQMDATYTETEGAGQDDYSWNAIWDSAGLINEQGYSVELAIPFNQLRFERGSEKKTWGLIAERILPRNNVHRFSTIRNDRSVDSLLRQEDKISGFAAADPGHNIELTPTLTTTRFEERHNFPYGNLQEQDSEFDLGLTGRWGVTPNLRLSFTVNPDFSQVEADDAVLRINQQFALFFAEKRPFFLEGAEIFQSGLDLVHTRTIADPDWGGKLTGKVGSRSLGFFSAEDRITNLLFPGSEGSRNTTLFEKNISTVGRLRQDFGSLHNFGFTITDRRSDSYQNDLFSADSFFRLDDSNSFYAQIVGTRTSYPAEIAEKYGQPQGDFWGGGAKITLRHASRNLFSSMYLLRLDDGLRADLGFITQTGIWEYYNNTSYTFWEPGRHISRVVLDGYAIWQADKDGQLKLGGTAVLRIFGPMQSNLEFSVIHDNDRFSGKNFDRFRFWGSLSLRPTGDLYLRAFALQGDAIDRLHVRKGTEDRYTGQLDMQLGTDISVDLRHDIYDFQIGNARYYLVNISQTTLIFHLNRNLFVRGILQYEDTRRSPELYDLPVDRVSKDLFSQLLFTYKVNPQTALYLGFANRSLANDDISLSTHDRLFFVKMSFAWLM